MQVRISEDTYKIIKDIIDKEIWDTEQEIKDYAGYDCETDWRERWLKELETVRLDFVEGACMRNKDNGVDHSVAKHMYKDPELDRVIKELTESVESHYVYEDARLLGWLKSYRKLHGVLDDVVAQVQKLLEASEHALVADPELCRDDSAFSLEFGTKTAYEEVLKLIEKCRRRRK